jgi:hypothetical protein
MKVVTEPQETKGDLIDYRRQMKHYDDSRNIIDRMVKGVIRWKMKKFNEQYGQLINEVIRDHDKLIHEYFHVDEKGVIKKEDGKRMLKEGKDEKEFEEKFNAFKSEPVEVYIPE